MQTSCSQKNPLDKILYWYGIYQDLYREMEKTLPNITFLEGLLSQSEIEYFTRDRHNRIIVSGYSGWRHGIVIHSRLSPEENQCRIYNSKHFPEKNQAQNHRSKHNLPHTHEQRERYIPGSYARSSDLLVTS
jgi:hypothetical protein